MQQHSEVDELGQQSARTARIVTSMVLRFAEISARYREQRSRQLQALREQTARDYAARFNLDRSRAERQLRDVHDPGWWNHATADQIIERWASAQIWHEKSPSAHDAQRVIDEQLQRRFGVTVDELFDRGERHRNVNSAERRDLIADLDRAERAEASDRAAEHDDKIAELDETEPRPEAGAEAQRDRASAGPDSIENDQIVAHQPTADTVNARAAGLIARGVSVDSVAAVIRDFPEGPSGEISGSRRRAGSKPSTGPYRGRSRDRELGR